MPRMLRERREAATYPASVLMSSCSLSQAALVSQSFEEGRLTLERVSREVPRPAPEPGTIWAHQEASRGRAALCPWRRQQE